MVISDTVLMKRHSVGLVCFAIFYLSTNFYNVKIAGKKPIYWFLTWEDANSYLIATGILSIFLLLFVAIAKFDEKLTGRSASLGKIRKDD